MAEGNWDVEISRICLAPPTTATPIPTTPIPTTPAPTTGGPQIQESTGRIHSMFYIQQQQLV